MNIEIIDTDHGWTVIHGERFADGLCPDEALGVVAAILMSGDVRYMKTYADQIRWIERYGWWGGGGIVQPVAFLADLRSRGSPYVATRAARVVRTFDELGQVVNRFAVPR